MDVNLDSIPDWDGRGLLPAYLDEAGAPSNRSPYRVSLTAMVKRFGDTLARRDLLTGFLDFRASLHQAGLTRGFQWVNGSFVTDIMHIENREPQDIDVITCYHLPKGHTETDLAIQFPYVFDIDNIRIMYMIDNRFINLNIRDAYILASYFTYYNSLLSHTRAEPPYGEHWWKGYLELDLSANEDADARTVLMKAAGREEVTS